MAEVTVDGKTLYEYWGNCHCGLARYSCKLDKKIEDIKVTACNCSKCFKGGLSNVYPAVEHVNFVRGLEDMTKFYVKDNGFPHRFCPKCGVTVMIGPDDKGGPGCAINVRTLEENEYFDWNRIQFNVYDYKGKPDADPPADYKVTSTEGLPALEYYFGGCYCGAARFRMGLDKPIEQIPVAICNCSICFKLGIAIIRPKQENVEWVQGEDHLSVYRCGSGKDKIQFCKKCGTLTGYQFTSDRPNTDVNVRALDENEHFDWNRLEFCSEDGKSDDPQYVVPK